MVMLVIGGNYMEITQKILLAVTIIGAINWGLIGILDINLVALIFGNMTFFARVVYTLVGICGLINIGILLGHIDFKLD